jgi:hypothetical protein
LRLRKYGLKLNADKSIFGATTVQYLGYTINKEGVTLARIVLPNRVRLFDSSSIAFSLFKSW